MRNFSIFIMGYSGKPGVSGASYVGNQTASTFKEACKKYAELNPWWGKDFNSKRMTYMGVRLSDKS